MDTHGIGGDAGEPSRSPALRRALWLAPLLAAFVVRLPFLAGAWSTAFLGDEPQYLRLGREWAQFGTYSGQWPPLLPGLLALCFEVFGDDAANAARVLMTLLALCVGAALMQLAAVLAGRRAGLVAGWLYALYLPLVPYAHMAKSETPFLACLLPALLLLLCAAGAQPADGRGQARRWLLPVAGLCLGLGCLVRESGALVLLAVLVWCVLCARPTRAAGLRSALVVATAAGLVIAPWTARNLFAYGKIVPLAVTSGTNLYLGFNGLYTNFDLVRLADPNPEHVPGSAARAALLGDAPDPWPRSTEGNPAVRDGIHVQRGLAFAFAHPLYTVRTRLVRLADFFTPLSYTVKHLRLGSYHAPLDSRPIRVALGWLAVVQAALLLGLGVAALAWVRLAPRARALLALVAAALVVPGLVVAMSRFRVPLDALALVAVAALLAGQRARPSRRRALVASAGAVLLLGCWYLSLPPTVASLEALG